MFDENKVFDEGMRAYIKDGNQSVNPYELTQTNRDYQPEKYQTWYDGYFFARNAAKYNEYIWKGF